MNATHEANIRFQALNEAYWLAFSHSAAAAAAIRPVAAQAYQDYQQAFKEECAACGGAPLLTDEPVAQYVVSYVAIPA